MKTVFIAFPSLDDSEVFATIKDALLKAEHPERVTVGVALLYSTSRYLKDFKNFIKPYGAQIRFTEVKVTARNVFDTLGVGRGRKLASDLYRDEDYMLQIDSHSWFSENWDTKLVSLHQECVASLGLKKVVLTGYAGHYGYVGKDKREPITDHGILRYPFIHEHQRFSNVIPNWFDIPLPEDYPNKFVPCTKFNANFSFGDKNFGKYTGVLEEAIFFDEELTQTINLVKHGFNLVFPNIREAMVCHLYSEHANQFGGHRGSIPEYMSGIVLDAFDRKTKENYQRFIWDPSNRGAIEKWEKYAKCSLSLGPLRSNHIPEYFINVDDSDLKL